MNPKPKLAAKGASLTTGNPVQATGNRKGETGWAEGGCFLAHKGSGLDAAGHRSGASYSRCLPGKNGRMPGKLFLPGG